MTTTEIFLIAMLIIFAVPYLVWRLCRTDYWAPLVVVQIILGIVLGPGVLGCWFPDYYAFVFNREVIQSLNGIAWWAVMLFVCIAGVELDLRKAWAHRRESGITAGLALGVPLLAGITLDITPGELVAIMGPSGSGKSTLLHCMSGVLTPTHGSVRYGDEELSALSDTPRSRTRLRNFGFVFQDGQLLPELSNVDNVALPAMLNGMGRGAARRRAMELLDQLGLGGLADRRPAQVSGGQAQRVTIARALVANPGVVFADEPTGALDQSTGHEVMQMLTTTVRQSGASLVMVTHDPSAAAYADRVVLLADGRLAGELDLLLGLRRALPRALKVGFSHCCLLHFRARPRWRPGRPSTPAART